MRSWGTGGGVAVRVGGRVEVAISPSAPMQSSSSFGALASGRVALVPNKLFIEPHQSDAHSPRAPDEKRAEAEPQRESRRRAFRSTYVPCREKSRTSSCQLRGYRSSNLSSSHPLQDDMSRFCGEEECALERVSTCVKGEASTDCRDSIYRNAVIHETLRKLQEKSESDLFKAKAKP